MLPLIIYSTTIARPDGGKTCNIMWPSMEAAIMGTNVSLEDAGFMAGADASTFTQYTFTIGFAIPLCLILIFYYLVLRKLRTVGPKTKSKEKKRSHRKVTKLVLTVIAVYVLSWLPYWVSVWELSSVYEDDDVHDYYVNGWPRRIMLKTELIPLPREISFQSSFCLSSLTFSMSDATL